MIGVFFLLLGLPLGTLSVVVFYLFFYSGGYALWCGLASLNFLSFPLLFLSSALRLPALFLRQRVLRVDITVTSDRW